MIRKMLAQIGRMYPLKEKDPGEYGKMKLSGMTFRVRAFSAEGLGHVSAMEASGFFGLMKMDTLIIAPTRKDMPLFSYDRVNAMGNDTMIFELYDTLLGETALTALEEEKETAQPLPDHDLGEHWYDGIKLPVSLSKKGKQLHSKAFDVCASRYLQAYLQDARGAMPTEPRDKREKTSVYVEGLLEHGGPSTDVFRKGIGQEKTAQLFRKVLFGTR